MDTKKEFRIEKDSMGEMQVPQSALYGAQTQRAVENFPISDLRLSRSMIAALGLIKKSAAQANQSLGLLEPAIAALVQQAADEVYQGVHDAHFVVDVFQTGSGTSSNMNANEVIANRARQLGSGEIPVHPNDHVNMSQSSNDVFPTAMHIAAVHQIQQQLTPALIHLRDVLAAKEREYMGFVKTGRTHLMDATPITLGQEFSGYRAQIDYALTRLAAVMPRMLELPLGGTAVGTGLNTHPDFAKSAIASIASATGAAFVEASNHFEAQAAKDALVELNGQLKTIACSLAKIANDIRWMGSGPRCGLGELQLPAVQPGSSIMPGKVNPVIAESVLMVVARVIGNDATATYCGHSGSILELNVMMPILAHATLESISLLASSARNFADQCVADLKPNVERLAELAEASIATCTALAPIIGYDRAAQLAKTAFTTGKPLRQVAREENVLPQAELDAALDLMSMTKPGL